jgi:adenosylcobinamide-phosphate synthase
MPALLTLLALLIEAMAGYPDWLARRIGHPAMWMGALIDALDRAFNRDSASVMQRRLLGIASLVFLISVVGGIGFAMERTLLLLPLGLVAVAIIASTLIAQRSLYDHVARVAIALERNDLAGARAAVSHIVGRETADLDEAAVARAAIESLAENFSDGVVAPAFWMIVAGLPGAAICKAVNTADSMIGHRTPRHEAFGWASARADDLLNLPASRLAALLIAGAACLTSRHDGGEAIGTVIRDADRHRSPNAGYPEAAMAGALGLALGGPRAYGETSFDEPWLGEGRYAASAADIRAALALYIRADALLIALVALIAALIWII